MVSRSSLDRTLDHLRYLYSENTTGMLSLVVLAIPSIGMIGSIWWIGFQALCAVMAPVFAGATSAVSLVLALLEFPEAAPVLPMQVREWKERLSPRNRVLSGWAHILLALLMAYIYLTQLTNIWAHERAAAVWMMPQTLGMIGVFALYVGSIIAAYHRLPLTIHGRIMEYTQAEAFWRDYKIVQDSYLDFIIKIGKRTQSKAPLSKEEVDEWNEIAVVTRLKLNNIQDKIISDLRGGIQ